MPALPNALRLGRALGALRHAMSAEQDQEFDDVATADFIAATGLVQPVFRPTRDRWLDLVLVVDQSPSMVVWGSTVSELRAVVGRHNAFNRVRFGLGSLGLQSTTFGVLSQTAGDQANSPRQIQLALKLYF